MPTPAFTPSGQHARLSTAFLSGGMLIILALAVVKFALHMYFNNRYGYFRDEFDYMACGDHLAWGYVDQPPLIPFLIRASRAIGGDSLRSIRFIPAVASSATVVLAAMMARAFGGRTFALILTAVCVAVAPIYLNGASMMTTNCLEPLLWMGCAYMALLAIQRNEPRYWLWFGVIAGIGLEEKYSIAVLGFALVVGLLLTEQRRFLWSRWMWIGGVAALVIFLPNLLWNIHNHWPFVQLMHNIKANHRDIELSPLEYFWQQLLLIQPGSGLVWLSGIGALLFWKPLRPYRLFGWAYLVAFTVFVILKGKNYYLAPIYPVLLASGAMGLEHGIERIRQGWIKPALVVILAAGGIWFAPLVMPILPVDKFVPYMYSLPIKVPRSEHSHMRAVLPQHFADQFGWEEMVAAVAKIYHSLPADEQQRTAIFGNNYGEAGAVDFFGPKYGLPKSIGGHQNYWLWGPRNYTGEIMIVLGDDREGLEPKCASIQEFDLQFSPYALEDDPIFLCRGFKWTLQEAWPWLKQWH